MYTVSSEFCKKAIWLSILFRGRVRSFIAGIPQDMVPEPYKEPLKRLGDYTEWDYNPANDRAFTESVLASAGLSKEPMLDRGNGSIASVKKLFEKECEKIEKLKEGGTLDAFFD